jgi:poly(A) polymerase
MKMHNNLITKLLDKDPIKRLFDIFENEKKEVRIVGGSIRDALLGIETKDIDIAANIHPDEIIAILKKHKLNYENFAYKYGSITTIIESQKIQITTLREDINQMGRHTNIIFTNDWKKDAARRDFTINALYLSSNGEIQDYFNGEEDLKKNIIHFIGNIEISIQEDFLRIFRYYRFLGIFEDSKSIQGYEKILSQYFEKSFNHLSNDLIRQEILKMFNTSFPRNCFFNRKNSMKKKYWVELVKQHFIKTSYDIGLNKCLNKIDLLIN